jgi:hypothetical protein
VGLSFSVAGFDLTACNGGPWLASVSSTTSLTLANAAGVLDTHAATATDNWSSLINQTPNTSSPDAFNALERAGISGETNYFDIQHVVDPTTLDKWPVSYFPNITLGTTANFFTLDGTHESATGNTVIQQSHIVNTNRIHF